MPDDKNFTPAEQKFFHDLRAAYQKTGGKMTQNEQHFLEKLAVELKKPGQLTIPEMKQVVSNDFMENLKQNLLPLQYRAEALEESHMKAGQRFLKARKKTSNAMDGLTSAQKAKEDASFFEWFGGKEKETKAMEAYNAAATEQIAEGEILKKALLQSYKNQQAMEVKRTQIDHDLEEILAPDLVKKAMNSGLKHTKQR